jgi:ABC-type lipoprotein export system ATPase subunit
VTHDPAVAAYTRKTFRLVDGRIVSVESIASIASVASAT